MVTDCLVEEEHKKETLNEERDKQQGPLPVQVGHRVQRTSSGTLGTITITHHQRTRWRGREARSAGPGPSTALLSAGKPIAWALPRRWEAWGRQ